MNYRLLTFLFSFFSLSYSFSQTTVSPLILSNQVWTAAGSPYSLPQNTYIDTGVTVTVMPGAEIIGAGGYTTLYIDGAFNILGKADSIVHVSGLIINYKQKSGIRYAAKGGEATNVVLMTDLTQNTMKGYERNPDDENRLFYVGATRTKENLHIIEPKQPNKGFIYEAI